MIPITSDFWIEGDVNRYQMRMQAGKVLGKIDHLRTFEGARIVIIICRGIEKRETGGTVSSIYNSSSESLNKWRNERSLSHLSLKPQDPKMIIMAF
jgi:hypothetical protein